MNTSTETTFSPPGGHSAADQRKLLVVEDEALVALQIATLMENLGWSIIGPVGSLEAANALLDDGQRPDVAILDVNLGGAPVFPLAETLRRRGIPILFCTGYEDQDEAEGFTEYPRLRKPWGVGQMVSEVNMLMERREAA